jgi:hypothetical protein
MSRLSEEVKHLVESDAGYVEMRDSVSKRRPNPLLSVIRKVVKVHSSSLANPLSRDHQPLNILLGNFPHNRQTYKRVRCLNLRVTIQEVTINLE